MLKILPDIQVMGVVAKNGVIGASKAFDELESKLSSLKKRRFFGVLIGKPDSGEYRACVEKINSDNPESLGLETYTIPGGKYEQEKLWDWESKPDQIGKTAEKIIKEFEIDSSRPTIEYYCSLKELRLLIPIK